MISLSSFIVLAACLGWSLADEPATRSALETDPTGWVEMLPGKDLQGWRRVPIPPETKLNAKNPWKVDAGSKVLLCDGVGVQEMLLHETEWGDGIFHVEWRFRPVEGKTGYNSGIYVRTALDGKPWHQVQVAHLKDRPLMGDLFYDRVVSGKLQRIIVEGQGDRRVKAPGEWNTYEITCRGPSVTVWINGAVTTTCKDFLVARGHFGLQAEGWHIEFRNLKFKELKAQGANAKPLELGSRRELFVDTFLIDKLQGVQLALERPRDEGVALALDKPWEGRFCGYTTIIHDGPLYRAYYRGLPNAGKDGSPAEVTCCAESKDGITWTKPELGLFEVQGTRRNNVVLAGMAPLSHNFCPMLDGRPGVPKSERYKALAGTRVSGLVAFISENGLHWRKLQGQPVITQGAFDSQNVPFWSEQEQCYVCYFRVFEKNIRRIARTTSKDFLHWTEPVLMGYGDQPIEHLYTNQTSPYFRAPQLYVGLAARFFPGRQVITAEQARAINVDPGYFKDCSDGVLLTTRGGDRYDRTFMEGFVNPGIGLENWVSRTNYPALNVVQTGPHEMSFYVNQNYGQPTSHLRRYSLRLDGFAAATAPYAGGELLTKPLTFTGKELVLNFATSAAGGIRVEIQDAAGNPLPGFALADAVETIGNEIDRVVRWKSGTDVSALAGKPVRLRFVMHDARLYALWFRS
jgi:hypothetical protein